MPPAKARVARDRPFTIDPTVTTREAADAEQSLGLAIQIWKLARVARGRRARRKLNTIKNRNSPMSGFNGNGISTSERRFLITKRNDIGTREGFLLNHISKRFY